MSVISIQKMSILSPLWRLPDVSKSKFTLLHLSSGMSNHLVSGASENNSPSKLLSGENEIFHLEVVSDLTHTSIEYVSSFVSIISGQFPFAIVIFSLTPK